MTIEVTKGSVFNAIEDDVATAELLRVKAALMDRIRSYIAEHGLTQQQAADLMGVQRSRIGDVARGHISVFSIDALVAMAARVNLHPLEVAA
jgi:predicted XRE-type DNA-binding protein